TWSRNQTFGASGRFLAERADRGGDGAALEPERALDPEHELEVHVVARVARDDVTEHRTAEQREIADEIEDLVPHELVAVPEAVHDGVLADDDGVLERSAARQTVFPHRAKVLQE